MPSPNFQYLNLILSSTFFFIKTKYAFSYRLLFSAVYHHKSNGHDSQSFLLQCLFQRRFQEARQQLDKIPQRNRREAVVVWTSILSKYARDGYVDEARALFELMPVRNVVTYNALLSAYVHAGRISEACKLFGEMPERNVVSWTSMLCGLTHAGRINDAKELFNCMPDRNVVSWNSMIVGLIRNGDLLEARRLFDTMPESNQVSWNTMISGYADNHLMEEARVLFDAMSDPNVVTWTCLIAGYCRAGDVDQGYKMFQRMPLRNIVSWTAMIGGFAWNGFYNEALLLFLEMSRIHEMRPNGETFISLVYACSGLGYPLLGMQIHTQLILNGFCNDDYDGRLLKGLIYMYSEFGVMAYSHHLYSMSSNNHITQSGNAIINGYIQIGLLEKARDFFETLPICDSISWTSMIVGYFHAGNVEEACYLFDRMLKRDDVAWTVMISGHIQNELFVEAMHFFLQMRMNGVRPLDSAFSTLLGAAGATADLNQGKQLHCQLMKTKSKLDIILENSLISMYAKCGEIVDAQCVFSNMITRDIVSWNCMILGFSHHGLVNEALELFDAMQKKGNHPNSGTFLGLLSGCSHTGMVKRGWDLFNSMSGEYAIQPGVEHYVCMVDLLGRAGKVNEAEEFVMTLPFEPGPAIWGAFLGVCVLGKVNADIAIRAAQRVLELDPTNAPAHVLLCNIYAAIGQHGKEGILRKVMGSKGIRKVPGCSWIMLKGSVNVFLSGDKSHPQANEIFAYPSWYTS